MYTKCIQYIKTMTQNVKYILTMQAVNGIGLISPEGIVSNIWRYLRKGLSLASNAVDKSKCMILKRPTREFLESSSFCSFEVLHMLSYALPIITK